MYKNKPAVTLIETLISLTIVGIALIALLPVVTVRKASTVTDFGNIYWVTKEFNDAGTPPSYLCPNNAVNNQAVSIGAGDTVPTGNFTFFSQGFGNDKNFPLEVTGRLVWNDTTIKESAANKLHLGSNVSEQNNDIHYNNNLYLNGITTFVLEQNDIATQALKQTDDHTFELLENGTDILANISTIRLEGNEYMHVYNNQHIGIGKNALKGSAVNLSSLTYPVTVIANNKQSYSFSTTCGAEHAGGAGAVASKGEDACINPDLVIGAKKVTPSGTSTNFYNTPADWVIHHGTGNSEKSISAQFTINADVVQFDNIQVPKVILPSDRRLKTILADYTKGIKELLQVKPVEFVYKNDKNKEHHIGVIAQDLRKVFPEAVEINSATGYLMVGTEAVFYSLINAVKELNLKNQDLKAKNDELEAKIVRLRKIRDDLKASQGGAK